MKKVLKLSSLLAAVLLLSVLAGVQLLSAQTVDVEIGQDFVSSDDSADNDFEVTVTDAAAGTMVTSTVKNRNTKETLDITVSGDPLMATVTVYGTTTDVASVSEPYILASHGDVIEVTYRKVGSQISHVDTVTVDAKGPVVSNLSPAHNTRTKAGTIRFSADLKDAGVGLGEDADAVQDSSNFTILDEGIPGKATKPEDGGSTLSVVVSLGEGAFDWQVSAKDALGNETMSEAVADDADTDDEDETVEKHTVVVDITPPAIDSATTGVVLDTSEDKATAEMTGSRTGIAVTFSDGGPSDVEDSGGLNEDTIDDSDFRVDVDKQTQAIKSVVFNSDLPKMVFITLEDELAGDDEPVVRLVGPVSDTAGNSHGTGETTAADGIAPKLTISVDGSSGSATNGTLTVLLSSDEKARNPSRNKGITVTEVVEADSGDNEGKQVVGTATVNASSFRTVTGGEEWEWTFKFKEGDNAKYNVCVEVSDISGDSGNEGTKGTCEAAALIDADKSVVFEVDTGIAVDIEDAVTPMKTDNTGAFIEIDMSGEGSEYVGDSLSKITTLSATIGDESVDVNTIDSKRFTIAPPAEGYAVGEHEIVVTATDETGNTTKFDKVTVEITARAAFKINLRPGYNLISLPGAPDSTDINDVIGADHSINQVLTYVGGEWMTAERGDDGAFAGTLTAIDGSAAYIVRTTSFEPLEVSIPRMTLGNVLPPQTNLAVGWNLVPVIDLTSDRAAGDTIEGYFQGVGEAILTIDGSGRLVAVAGDDAMVGRGYWVYASRPAVLLP